MKLAWTRSEKLLFAAPLLLLAMTAGGWVWHQSKPKSLVKVQPAAPDPIMLVNPADYKAIQFSPEGKRIMVLFDDNRLPTRVGEVYDVATGTRICDLKLPPTPNPTNFPWLRSVFLSPSWSRDGKYIVAGYNNNRLDPLAPVDYSRNIKNPPQIGYGKIATWDANSGALTGDFLFATTSDYSRAESIRFSSDSKRLFGDGTPPAVFDIVTGKRLSVVRGTLNGIVTGVINDQMGMAAIWNKDRTRFQVVEIKTGKVVWEPEITIVGDVKWCGTVLGVQNFISGLEKDSMFWDAKTRQPLSTLHLGRYQWQFIFNEPEDTVTYFDLTEAPISVKLMAWDYRTGRKIERPYSSFSTNECQWSPDGKWLSTTMGENSETAQELLVVDDTGKLRFRQKLVHDLYAWSPDSQYIATLPTSRNGRKQIVFVPISEALGKQ